MNPVKRACKQCGREFIRPKFTTNATPCLFCSRQCAGFARRRGDRFINPDGYVLVRSKDHPRSSPYGFIHEHILVIERKLGRFLIPPEEVHHKNHIRSDNDPDNLILCRDRKEHMAIHAADRIRTVGGNPETQRWCSGCGVQDKTAFSNHKKMMCRSCHAAYEKERKSA